jgi:hypothetical protein
MYVPRNKRNDLNGGSKGVKMDKTNELTSEHIKKEAGQIIFSLGSNTEVNLRHREPCFSQNVKIIIKLLNDLMQLLTSESYWFMDQKAKVHYQNSFFLRCLALVKALGQRNKILTWNAFQSACHYSDFLILKEDIHRERPKKRLTMIKKCFEVRKYAI